MKRFLVAGWLLAASSPLAAQCVGGDGPNCPGPAGCQTPTHACFTRKLDDAVGNLQKNINALPPEQRAEALKACGILFERHKAYRTAVGSADMGLQTRTTTVLRVLEVKPKQVEVPTEVDRLKCFAQIGGAAARLLNEPGNEEFAAAIETWKWDNIRTTKGKEGQVAVTIDRPEVVQPPAVRPQAGLEVPSVPLSKAPPLERKVQEAKVAELTRQAEQVKERLSKPAERDSLVKVIPPSPGVPPPTKEQESEDKRAGHQFVRRLAGEAAEWLRKAAEGKKE